MKYVALAVVGLSAGSILGLTSAQVSVRAHAVRPAQGRAGFYEAIENVQFKRGETFIYLGDIPKHLADAVQSQEGKSGVELVADQKAKAETRKKAKEAETKKK